MADQLSPRDVLGVLSQWELELTQRENERRSLKYVRGVMEAFQAAQSALTGLRAEEVTLKTRLATVASSYAEKERDANTALQATLADHQRMTDGAQAQLHEVQTTLASAESDLREKELFAAKRLAVLEKEIDEKKNALARVQKSFDAFIGDHGLKAQ